MSREYRQELKKLETKKRFLVRSQARQTRSTQREINRIETAAVRDMRAVIKSAAKLTDGLEKEIAIIAKRQAILVGRLS